MDDLLGLEFRGLKTLTDDHIQIESSLASTKLSFLGTSWKRHTADMQRFLEHPAGRMPSPSTPGSGAGSERTGEIRPPALWLWQTSTKEFWNQALRNCEFNFRSFTNEAVYPQSTSKARAWRGLHRRSYRSRQTFWTISISISVRSPCSDQKAHRNFHGSTKCTETACILRHLGNHITGLVGSRIDTEDVPRAWQGKQIAGKPNYRWAGIASHATRLSFTRQTELRILSRKV